MDTARAATLLVPVMMDKEGDMLEGVVEKARRLRRQAGEARAGMVSLSDAWRKAGYRGSRGDAKPGTLEKAKAIFAVFVRDAMAAGAEAGVPLAVIQSWLGHTSPMVTRIYARVEDMRAKREAMSKFPRLG